MSCFERWIQQSVFLTEGIGGIGVTTTCNFSMIFFQNASPIGNVPSRIHFNFSAYSTHRTVHCNSTHLRPLSRHTTDNSPGAFLGSRFRGNDEILNTRDPEDIVK